MNQTIKFKEGGQFNFVKTNENLHPSKNGNTIYIISLLSDIGDNNVPIRGTRVTERSIKFILEKFPNIKFIQIYITTKEMATILEKAYYKIFNKTIIINPPQSMKLPIR